MISSYSFRPVVARDVTRDKHLSCFSKSSLKQHKRAARRAHRRSFRQFLHIMIVEDFEEPADLEPRFKKLHCPRLTGYDIV